MSNKCEEKKFRSECKIFLINQLILGYFFFFFFPSISVSFNHYTYTFTQYVYKTRWHTLEKRFSFCYWKIVNTRCFWINHTTLEIFLLANCFFFHNILYRWYILFVRVFLYTRYKARLCDGFSRWFCLNLHPQTFRLQLHSNCKADTNANNVPGICYTLITTE